jgi:predicted Zn-dependent protease with MMP-like domain
MAFSGGGVVVGNGAGIAENNFQYAYQSLDTILKNCLHLSPCNIDSEETELVKKIIAIVENNENKKDRLVFLSEKRNPGFFTTGEIEENRIAKTFLNADSSIYINVDQLYRENGESAISYEQVIAILVHELGHQTGIAEHAPLDILGTKIASFALSHIEHYAFDIDDENKSVDVLIGNFNFPVKSSLIIFNGKNNDSLNLTEVLYNSLECKYSSESFAGVELSNGHFEFDSKNNLNFKAWVKVQCFESFSESMMIYKKNLSLSFDENFQFIAAIVE